MTSDQWPVKADRCGKDGRREEGEAVVRGEDWKDGREEGWKTGKREDERTEDSEEGWGVV